MAKAAVEPTRARRARHPSSKSKPRSDALIKKRDALPFFSEGKRGESSSWWSVAPTGNYREDYERGRRYAMAVLPLMIHEGGPPSLAWVLSEMFEVVSKRKMRYLHGNKLSGIEVGFMRGLGDLIIAAMASVAVVADPTLIKKGRVPSRMVEGITKITSLLADSNLAHDKEQSAKIRARLNRAAQ